MSEFENFIYTNDDAMSEEGCKELMNYTNDNLDAIKEIQEHDLAISSLDVLGFKVDQLREEIGTLREVDREIMTQHEKIFDWMASNGRSASGGNPYDDGY